MSKRRNNGARRPANTASVQKGTSEQIEEVIKAFERAEEAGAAGEPERMAEPEAVSISELVTEAETKEAEQTAEPELIIRLEPEQKADSAAAAKPERGADTAAELCQKDGKASEQTAEAEVHIEPEHAEVIEFPEIEQIVLPEKERDKPVKKVQKEHEKTADDEGEQTKALTEEASGHKEKKSSGLFGALLRKMIFCISLGIFSYALASLAVLLWGYYISQKEYEELNEATVVIGTTAAPDDQEQNPDIVVELPGDGSQSVKAPYLEISVDERKLKALNQDYAFYIVIPDTNIQYPVVQGEDNNHYLRYTYSNQENTAGAIALDYRTDRNTYLQSFNTIISGHNRQDGTMFSDLASYKDESFRDKHPYIYIVMGDKEYVYEVFSFYAMEPVAVCYNPNVADDIYLNFVNDNNTYQNEIEVTLEDHIITLYTCNEDSSMRYLCHAVLRAVYDLK